MLEPFHPLIFARPNEFTPRLLFTHFTLGKEGMRIAPPWLIDAELMNSADLRSHEAAEELYKEFLF